MILRAQKVLRKPTHTSLYWCQLDGGLTAQENKTQLDDRFTDLFLTAITNLSTRLVKPQERSNFLNHVQKQLLY